MNDYQGAVAADDDSIAGSFRRRLAAKQPTYLLALRAWSNPEIVHLAHTSGHHAIYIDFQHGAFDMSSAMPLLMTAVALKMPAFVRVAKLDAAAMGVALDLGAAGIIVPDVETRAQVLTAIAAARHPPVGNRSIGGARGYKAEPSPVVIAMIESAAAVGAVDAIASVPGLDAIMIGSQDLKASLLVNEPELGLDTATQQVIDAAARVGVPAIVAGMRDPEHALEMMGRGASSCFSVGTDVAYTLQAAIRQITTFDQVLRPVRRHA